MGKYLSNKKVYLSGAIEYNSDGFNWRIEPKQQLESRFGLDVFDPFADPKQQWVPELNEAQKNKDLVKMKEIASKFVRKDLANVDESKFLIAHFIHGLPTTGTHHEVINANNAKKPTLLLCEKGAEFIPKWYFGFISLDYLFGSWEELYSYLQEVDDGKHMDDDRWSIVYDLI
ncbi:MAG: hypothetical protein DWQ19_12565 [Crenarchaeota archaeon]|nr:MAG: hypothetical protein DWQ19_12565 [Thermoproteota archaeon]